MLSWNRIRPVLLLAAIAPLVLSGCGGGSRVPPGKVAAAKLEMAAHDMDPAANTEAYDRIAENPFILARQHPLSTFSIDVDTASYSNIRRFLNEGQLPPKDAVRIEECINYFTYDYPQPSGEHPVSMTADAAGCPWNSDHRLVRIGLQGKRLDPRNLPPRNLVFLIDVSGSMEGPNRLLLVKQALALLVEQLTEKDRVAMVVYAGQSGLVLPPTPGHQKGDILSALNRLEAGGSTNGGQGIQLAYQVAQRNFHPEGINRVILCTDGDFNVGVTGANLLQLVEEKRKLGVYLTVLGFGMGNLKDSTLEKLAVHGNGQYGYIDSLAEARKVFVEEGAALVTIAKDVKIQVEFNPARVSAYRLIGYENRMLRSQDFNDDRKDAGDMGAGHTVTALYEIVPAGKPIDVPSVDPLKYQSPPDPTPADNSGELLTLKLRYKEPREDKSKALVQPVRDAGLGFQQAPPDFRFAAAVAAFGMVLRDSPHKGNASFAVVRELGQGAVGKDVNGHRAEFLRLVDRAANLAQQPNRAENLDATGR